MTMSTGEVAQQLSTELGRALSERSVNALLRRMPTIRPPLVAGRRAWRPTDVAALRAQLTTQ